MEHKRIEIGTGDEAIHNTLKHMKRLALRDSKDPIILKIADDIKRKCGNNETCKAVAGFDWVYENIKYEFDDKLIDQLQAKGGYLTQKIKNTKNEEFVVAPIYLVTKIKKGDCDDMSTLLASIYTALGLPVNFKIIAWKDKNYSHVYNEVGLKKAYSDGPRWVASDVVIKEFGQEKTPVIRWDTLRVN